MAYMPKTLVNYRETDPEADKRCGTCVMFRRPDSCTLVLGEIREQDVCDEWERKSGR